MKRILSAVAVIAIATASALAADPIVGDWKTEAGTTAAIGRCGGGYCIVLKTGKHKGEQIGTFKGCGGHCAGRITDPDARKTYNGTMTVSGNLVTMKGCVMRVFCQSQTWSRI